MHAMRVRTSDDCPVCGVKAPHPCIYIPRKTKAPEMQVEEIDEAEYLEFSIKRDLRRLRELNPDHYLSKAGHKAIETHHPGHTGTIVTDDGLATSKRSFLFLGDALDTKQR